MQVLLDMAISPNGYICREDGDEDWLPSDGWGEFVALAERMNNIVMGRETYDQVTARYEDYNFDSVECAYKVIVTRDKTFVAPSGYIVVHSPEEAVQRIADAGLSELFLIGGGKLNTEFIKRGLVHKLQLTINPYIIGKGRSFIGPEEFDLPLKLLEYTALSKGRLKLVYEVGTVKTNRVMPS